MVKRLEWLLKCALAVLMAALTFRPGRRARAGERLGAAKKVLLVRPDNRVGEALLTTPLVAPLAARGLEVHVLAHQKTVRVLEGLPGLHRAWGYTEKGRWAGPWSPLLRALRAERFDVVVNCGNWSAASVSSALLARLAGPHAAVLGPANFPSGWLMDVAVPPRPGEPSEVVQRAHLVSPLVSIAAPRLAFRAPRATPAVEGLPAALGRYAVVNPGGRLGERRVPPAVFAHACARLAEAGVTPLVTWGPGEEALRDEVCRAAPTAHAAPPTTLDELAFLMSRARLVVCNNTGPMHLAVAVGAPTLALFFAMDLARWGHGYAPHVMLDVTRACADGTAERVVAEAVAQALASSAGAAGR